MSGLFSSVGRKGLFLVDPEKAHGLSIAALKSGFLPTCMVPHDPRLQQTVAGLVFPNPLGMAAGYDRMRKYRGRFCGSVSALPKSAPSRPRRNPAIPGRVSSVW